MALTLSLDACICGDCNTLTVTDKTGLYSAVANPTGYTAANITNATAATIEVFDSAGTSLGSASVYSTLPDSDEPSTTWDAAALSANLGISSFSDGRYDITYTVTISGTAYTTTYTTYVICNVTKCVNAMFADLSTCGNAAEKRVRDKAMLALTYLKILEYQVACGDLTAAASTLTFVNSLCDGTAGCSTC